MNNEKYNQIIYEVYENFLNTYKSKNGEIILPPFDYIDDNGVIMSKEQFITNIKYDPEFSETWGLKIEERELSLRERLKLVGYRDSVIIESVIKSKGEYFHKNKLDEKNIPTKLITVTYNDIKTEVYV